MRQDIHEAKSLHVERRDAERVHINGVSCSYAQCVIHASYTYYVHGRYTIAHRIDNEREFRSAVQDVYDRYTRGETTSEMGLIQLYESLIMHTSMKTIVSVLDAEHKLIHTMT